jgi:uncharacterized coiled-coil protein SlyX
MSLTEEDRQWIVSAMRGSESRLVELITSVKESLENDIANLGVRFDNQAARIERHAGLLQTGNRWIARLNDWSAKVDASLEVKDQQIAALTERLRKLEQRNGAAT